MPQIVNIHDKFFQETFTRKDIAQSFLKHYLPEKIRQHINFETLVIVKDSFVDKDLREHFSDILYTLEFKDINLLVYMLFEHKSYPDQLVAFQILRYMVKIWEQYFKQNPNARKVPPIFPMVLYHGKTKWKIPDNFQSIITQDAERILRDWIPEFKYQIYDISHLSDEEIQGQVMSRLVLLVAKHIFQPDIREKLPEILSLLYNAGNQKTALEMLEIVMRYVVQATEKFDEKDIREIIKQSTIREDIMQTFIDKYINQGMQQGMQKGKIQLFIQMTEARFGGLPKWAVEKIEKADIATIEKWGIQLLKADSLKDVLRNG